jgi:hypothetical protein
MKPDIQRNSSSFQKSKATRNGKATTEGLKRSECLTLTICTEGVADETITFQTSTNPCASTATCIGHGFERTGCERLGWL